MTTQLSNASATYTAALAVWNRALEAHGDEAPYKQILGACERLLGDRRIPVEIHDEEADDQEAVHFSLRFEDGQLVPGSDDDTTGPAWKVSRQYLEKIAANPDRYVESPAKLEWDWLKDRLGLK